MKGQGRQLIVLLLAVAPLWGCQHPPGDVVPGCALEPLVAGTSACRPRAKSPVSASPPVRLPAAVVHSSSGRSRLRGPCPPLCRHLPPVLPFSWWTMSRIRPPPASRRATPRRWRRSLCLFRTCMTERSRCRRSSPPSTPRILCSQWRSMSSRLRPERKRPLGANLICSSSRTGLRNLSAITTPIGSRFLGPTSVLGWIGVWRLSSRPRAVSALVQGAGDGRWR